MVRYVATVLVLGSVVGCAGNDGDCASDLQTSCDGTCVFLSSDPNNCGACGITCTSGVCTDGLCEGGPGFDAGMMMGDCSPSCASTHRCCGRVCVLREQPRNVDGRPGNPDDPTSPFNNCNGCGITCDREAAISCSLRASGGTGPECLCGDAPCFSGEVCINSGGAYRCTSLSTDIENCGMIGNRCGEGETCTAGVCGCGGGARCMAGQACCGGTCVDTQADAANCGGCGMACGPESPNCVSGSCSCGTAGACEAPMPGDPFMGTMGTLGESCCDGACVPNDEMNCGGCGVMCDTSDPDNPETCINAPAFPPFSEGGICCAPDGTPFCGGFMMP